MNTPDDILWAYVESLRRRIEFLRLGLKKVYAFGGQQAQTASDALQRDDSLAEKEFN